MSKIVQAILGVIVVGAALGGLWYYQNHVKPAGPAQEQTQAQQNGQSQGPTQKVPDPDPYANLNTTK